LSLRLSLPLSVLALVLGLGEKEKKEEEQAKKEMELGGSSYESFLRSSLVLIVVFPSPSKPPANEDVGTQLDRQTDCFFS
jgi:hypothetical protein